MSVPQTAKVTYLEKPGAIGTTVNKAKPWRISLK